MQRTPKSLTDAVQLLHLGQLLTASAQIILDEWSTEDQKREKVTDGPPDIIPSRKLHEAQKTGGSPLLT